MKNIFRGIKENFWPRPSDKRPVENNPTSSHTERDTDLKYLRELTHFVGEDMTERSAESIELLLNSLKKSSETSSKEAENSSDPGYEMAAETGRKADIAYLEKELIKARDRETAQQKQQVKKKYRADLLPGQKQVRYDQEEDRSNEA